MFGYCSHCHQETTVWRYRLAEVGLRYLCVPCHGVLDAMGLHMAPVTIADPREADEGIESRRRPGIGVRAGTRWLRLKSSAA